MPRKYRLSRAEFPLGRGTKRLSGRFFTLSYSLAQSGHTKATCVVSKKVALKAHDRNLLKRRCREAVRKALPRMKVARTLVLQAKRGAAEASFDEIRQDIDGLLQSFQ